MAVEKIQIELKTQADFGGTRDALYLGVISKLGGREFPLRYDADGLRYAADEEYVFAINDPDAPADQQVFDSGADGRNGLNAFPLVGVERVYLRKEPRREQSDKDDALGVYYVGAFITDDDGNVVDWSNRNRPGSSGPSPFWLGNEFGQIVYLKPDILP